MGKNKVLDMIGILTIFSLVVLNSIYFFDYLKQKRLFSDLKNNCQQGGLISYKNNILSCDGFNEVKIATKKADQTKNSSVDNYKLSAVESLDWSSLTSYPAGCSVGQAVQVVGKTLTCFPVWDDISDLPLAIPSDGDTNHLSTADQIYDWVTGKGYLLDDSDVPKGDLENSGDLSFDWSNEEIANNLTIDSSSSVDWLALSSYPSGCSAGQAIQAVGDTLTCVDVGDSSLWTDGGDATYLSSVSDDLAIGGTNSSAPFYFDTGSSLLKILNLRAGDDSNYLNISSSGHLTLVGNATVWDDVRVPISGVKTGGSKIPDFGKFKDNGSSSQGVFTYLFDPDQEQEVYFTVQLPHSYKAGTNIKPHIHWTPINTGSGDVIWGLEYTWTKYAQAFGDTTIITTSQAASGTAYQHQIAGFTEINGTGRNESSMLVCRVFRDADDGDDDYGSDAALLEIDFHFEIEKMGTDNEYPD